MMSVVPGMIIMPMTSAKRSFFPGNSNRARQYASAEAMIAARTIVMTATMTLLMKLR